MGLMDDDLIIPDFSEDDEPDLEVAAEESQNRTFLIASAVLAGIFILGLCAALFIILGPTPGQPGQATSIAQTNSANMTFAAETAVAAQVTSTPIPTDTQEAEATATQQPEPATVTPTPLIVATQTVAAADLATLSETQIAEGTTTPFATVEPPTAQATVEVTQIGGADDDDPTPTRIVSGVGGAVTATALPDTGIAIGTNVAGIGLLTLALVAVVFVARRLRLSK